MQSVGIINLASFIIEINTITIKKIWGAYLFGPKLTYQKLSTSIWWKRTGYVECKKS